MKTLIYTDLAKTAFTKILPTMVGLFLLAGCTQQDTNTSPDVSTVLNEQADSVKQGEPSPSLVLSENACTNAFFEEVEQALLTGDGQGHGPDMGSQEWKSVVEFKLGVRGQDEVPTRDSIEWCDYIKAQIAQR